MTARRPRIGITAWLRTLPTVLGDTPLHTASLWYVSAVEAAGGLPLVLPGVEEEAVGEVLDVLDGLLVTGGEDVAASRYGQEPHPKAQQPDLRRDAFEVAALEEADRRDVPVFCICRGVQVLNVARGGTLVQDIPTQLEGAPQHARPDAFFEPVHDVRLEPGSRTAAILGTDRLAVNTSHHQAVERLGHGLRAVAFSPEGIVEAVEDERPDRILFGVQWHPEALYESHPEHHALFRALVEAAGDRSRS